MNQSNLSQTPQANVLLIDDDTALCELLQEYLQSEDFQVSYVNDGQSAIERLTHNGVDVAVLDIMMPKVSGLDVLREVRRIGQEPFVPIIMLTGKGDDIDRILGLEMGADDYMAKPCNPRELAARIRAVLRRTQSPVHESANANLDTDICLHGLKLQPSSLSVEVLEGNKPIELTGVEFRLIFQLAKNVGHIISKAELTEHVLQRKLTAHDRSIDVHISRIRQKLANEAQLHDIIKSVRGAGYQMVTDDDAHA